MNADAPEKSLGFLAGGGDMERLIRAHNWAATPVGPPESWPQALKTTVQVMLKSSHPMFIWWGEALTSLYNDAFSALIGPDRHPSALGRPGREVWGEIWDVIGPQIDFVMEGRGPTSHERQLIPITRGGALEDVWWTYGYSPVDNDGSANGVGGVLVICRDVTADMIAERTHTAEAERLRQFFEQAPGFMVMLRGPLHVFELANPSFVRLIGRDVVGKPAREGMPDLEGQGFFELLERVYATGEAVTARRAPVILAADPDGASKQVFVDFVYQPVRDAAGAVSGIFVEGNDVTQAKLDEDALRASEARQDLLLRLVRGQRESDDVDAMMRAASEAVGRHLGANRVGFFDMLDDDTLKFTSGWTDGKLDPLAGTFPAVGIGTLYLAEVRAGRTLGIADCQHDPRTRDGLFAQIGAHSIIGVPILRNGRWVAGMYVNHATVRHWTDVEVSLVRDVAEQAWDAVERARAVAALQALNSMLEQQAQERTRERDRLWTSTNDLMGIAGADLRLVSVNPAWSRMLGDDAGELLGRPFHTLIDHTDGAAADVASRLAAGETVTGFVGRLSCKDSGPRVVMWDAVRDGDLLHIVGHDITELRQIEDQLRQAQKMEAVGQLTGGIAHDFNNLLTSILGALEMLQRRLAEGRLTGLERYTNIAVVAAGRATALTQRLLSFAHRQPLDPKPVDANRLLAGMADLLAGTLGPDIRLEMLMGDGLWLVLCDVNQLENAIFNLAINARDAMPGGGQLTVATANAHLDAAEARRAGNDVRPGEYVAITVADTGIGMSSEVVTRVFEPFFTTKPVGKGTGLGLSMLYGFVQQSGGHVRIDSEPGRGTTMRLYLPCHAGHADAPDEITAGPAESAGAPVFGTVLVVEDEAAIRDLVAEALADCGCRVLEADDSAAGQQILDGDERIDLLVADIGMPGALNGRELAILAQQRRPGLPVLFITGYPDGVVAGQDATLPAGMEVMAKPFALDALAAKVRAMLDRGAVKENLV